ncbi:MAG: TniB family NTP-binding protein [Legionellaceae bacterium]|nr:TniB family NTP-binding protein [Legionellaceae bacterium]MBP9775089.1 TniB family NTP-binding protein [Legionellaceae bacterium]
MDEISYEEAVIKLEALISHPKRQRMPNLLIVGPTNNGKSMIIEKFRRTHLFTNKEHYSVEEHAISPQNSTILLNVASCCGCTVESSLTCF